MALRDKESWGVVPALVACLLLAGFSGSARGERAAAIPPLPPATATEMGPVAQNPVILGRDGNFSAEFRGRSIWTFGDTPLSVPGASGNSWQDNTLSWTTDLDASDGIALDHDHLDSTGAPAEFLPLTPEEAEYNLAHDPDSCSATPCGAEFALWNGPIVSDLDRNRMLHFYTEIWRRSGSPEWRTVGSGIAVWKPSTGIVRPVVDPSSETPTLMWDSDDVQYNSAALVVGRKLYAYGCSAGFLVMYCNVARVGLGGALTESNWRYYTARGAWSADPALAAPVLEGGAAGSTVLYSEHLGHYVAIYSGVYDDDVFYRAAETPWGPWSEQALLFTAQPGWQGNVSYAAEAHPEFAEDNGRVQYVTYVHPTGFLRWDLPLVRIEFGSPAG